MTTTVFISYGRESQGKVRLLAEDLGGLGHNVWFDQELTGGQAWWAQILLQVQRCEVFVYALSPESIDSPACKCECTYAVQLGKSLLPVLVAEGVAAALMPPVLAQVQYVDYRREDKEALKALARALKGLPPSPPLPDSLPQPPAAPISYLANLADRIGTSEALSFQEQSELLLRLKHGLSDTKGAEHTRSLLRRFRSRDDLFARVADEIDALLRETGAARAGIGKPTPGARPGESIVALLGHGTNLQPEERSAAAREDSSSAGQQQSGVPAVARKKWSQRHPTMVAIAIVVLGILVGGASGSGTYELTRSDPLAFVVMGVVWTFCVVF